MEQSPWEADNGLDTPEILRPLWNSKDYYRVYKNAGPLESNPDSHTMLLLRSILILYFHLRLSPNLSSTFTISY
jgi:hypothetical protein